MSQPPSGGGPPDRFSRMFPFPGMIPIHALSPLEVFGSEGEATAHARAPPVPPGCLLTWLSAESDKCPTCRGELPSPAKKARCAYEALGVAELKRRCDERHVDASACVEKAELVKLLARTREDDAKRAARRAAGHPIPCPSSPPRTRRRVHGRGRRASSARRRRRRRRAPLATARPRVPLRDGARRGRRPRPRPRAAAPRRPAAARRASRRGPAAPARRRSPPRAPASRAPPARVRGREARRASRRGPAAAANGRSPAPVAATVLPASPEARRAGLHPLSRPAGGLGEPTVIRVNRDDLEQGGMPFPSPSR
ncbi:hypothetical protein JL722_13299 [Aureococcus anophagefferens]|nr:hypothetical protein JL722_13299 [Aureococcus anophagefferens]